MSSDVRIGIDSEFRTRIAIRTALDVEKGMLALTSSIMEAGQDGDASPEF